MKSNEMQADVIVRHITHGNKYRVISVNCRMKDSRRGWIDAVTYAPMYSSTYDFFVRAREPFLKEFELVTETDKAQ